LTMADLATKLGISRGTLARLESGATGPTGPLVAAAITALGLIEAETVAAFIRAAQLAALDSVDLRDGQIVDIIGGAANV